MSKRPSGRQIEMLLPITGKKAEALQTTEIKQPRALSYEKIVDSLRKKGLMKNASKKW